MKKVFFSFHYKLDNWRVNQIRNIEVVKDKEQRIFKPNQWEAIKRKGDSFIKNWIDRQMKGCDCVIVLIGEKTHTRKWVKYEVKRAKELGIPIFGIFIHNLKDRKHQTTKKGQNVFDIHCYEPNPKDAYHDIRDNLESWINRKTFSFFKFFSGFGLFIIVSFFLLYYKKITSVLANA